MFHNFSTDMAAHRLNPVLCIFPFPGLIANCSNLSLFLGLNSQGRESPGSDHFLKKGCLYPASMLGPVAMSWVGILVCLGCSDEIPQAARLHKQQKSISHSSEGCKSKTRVPAWSDFSEDPLLGWRLQTSCYILRGLKGRGNSVDSLL